jgi:hypothetical protein
MYIIVKPEHVKQLRELASYAVDVLPPTERDNQDYPMDSDELDSLAYRLEDGLNTLRFLQENTEE